MGLFWLQTLNKGINNTSLVLAFELQKSKKVLLFVGDAQRGNWISWAEGSTTLLQLLEAEDDDHLGNAYDRLQARGASRSRLWWWSAHGVRRPTRLGPTLA